MYDSTVVKGFLRVRSEGKRRAQVGSAPPVVITTEDAAAIVGVAVVGTAAVDAKQD